MSGGDRPTAQGNSTLCIAGVQAWVIDGWREACLVVRDGRVVALDDADPTAAGGTRLDGSGLLALPGLVDTTVAAAAAPDTAAVHGPIAGVTTAVTSREDRQFAFDQAVYQRQPVAGEGLLLDPADGHGVDTLRRLVGAARCRPIANLGGADLATQLRWLPLLLDAVTAAMGPLHIGGVAHAAVLEAIGLHPARRLVTAGTTAAALTAAAGDDRDGEDVRALWQSLQRNHGWGLDIVGGAGHGQGLWQAMAGFVAGGRCSWLEVVRWTAQRPAQALQLTGKGGLVPGLDGDVVLVAAQAPHAVHTTLLRGALTWPTVAAPVEGQRVLQRPPPRTAAW